MTDPLISQSPLNPDLLSNQGTFTKKTLQKNYDEHELTLTRPTRSALLAVFA